MTGNAAAVRGFTLIEMLVTVAIVTLVVSIGVPALGDFAQDARERSLVSGYLHAFNTARYAAVASHRHISICALDAKGKCTGRWHNRLDMFHDPERDGKVAGEHQIIDSLTVGNAEQIKVSFRAFGGTRFVGLRPGGYYRQNGTFRFCSPGQARGRAIIINAAGRARTATVACP